MLVIASACVEMFKGRSESDARTLFRSSPNGVPANGIVCLLRRVIGGWPETRDLIYSQIVCGLVGMHLTFHVIGSTSAFLFGWAWV